MSASSSTLGIRTNRLLLRPAWPEDVDAYRRIQQRPEYLQFTPLTERSDKAVREFLDRRLRWQEEIPQTMWGFTFVEITTGKIIGCGTIGLTALWYTRETWEGEVGLDIDYPYWGQGFGTESLTSLLAFGFLSLELNRIQADCLEMNGGSRRMMEKAGMSCEGTAVAARPMGEEWVDRLHYGITWGQWMKCLIPSTGG